MTSTTLLVSRRATITIIIMSSIIRQYRCSEVIIIIRVKAPPIKWYNQHMNSAIVVAYIIIIKMVMMIMCTQSVVI